MKRSSVLVLAGVLVLTAGSLRVWAAPPRVVFVIGDDEYKTETTLPAFARSRLEPLGVAVKVVEASKDNPNDFPGMDTAIRGADLVVISVRRRAPMARQLDALRAYLAEGKPLVGIRTACHAFALRGKTEPAPGHATWPEFDPEVLGGHYTNHHPAGPITTIQRADGSAAHPILAGFEPGALVGNGSLYKVRPLASDTTPLLIGTIPGQEPEPVAWTHTFGPKNARVFFTSLGHPADFDEPSFQKLLVNAMFWALDRSPPTAESSSSTKTSRNAKPAIAPAGMDRELKTSANVPSLRIPDDLELDLLLSEPVMANPLYINFDERGRMWVVQYRQYPWPAGLKLLSHDQFYRNVYDAVPPPPPHPPGSKYRGADRITIHEDRDGDGTYETTKIFLDGLSLATSALKGRGGVYVMNPPYLLFYADANGDDVPDSEVPRVLLSGFGIEDTHSIANNLRWGPDGWIYATEGSTVSASVVRHGPDGQPIPGEKPVHTMGQNVWRYHPESHRYEVFAEGGGNAFGVEIDSKGRVYSGHNGGDTRGFYYVEGGYYRKGFDKHGALSNPYTFGYLNAMNANPSQRFTHTFEIYEADALPDRYHGNLFGVAPHMHYVIRSEVLPEGSTFRTRDIEQVIVPNNGPRDAWFSPVDIQTGPDGALYLADWYAMQVAHYRGHEGLTDQDLGRVYRLRARTAGPRGTAPFDLGKLTSDELVDRYLGHPNRWYRQSVLRILGDRKDASLVPKLSAIVERSTGQTALEALWALNLCGGFDDAQAITALRHDEPHVRRWAVRLLGDSNGRALGHEIAARLVEMAAREPDVETRCQIAATARRLPTLQALPILTTMANRRDDDADPSIPAFVWWGIEAHAADRDRVLSLFVDGALWDHSLRFRDQPIAALLMRRYAAAGSRDDLMACARLLAMAPDRDAAEALVAGFSAAFAGRSIPPLPDELTEGLARVGGSFAIVLGVSPGRPGGRAIGAATGRR